jgi:hypothetical protein
MVHSFNVFNMDPMAGQLVFNTAIILRNYDLGTHRYVTETRTFHQNNYIIPDRRQSYSRYWTAVLITRAWELVVVW